MERLQPDESKLSALRRKAPPDPSLALSSTSLGGVARHSQRNPFTQHSSSKKPTRVSGQQGLYPGSPAPRNSPLGGAPGKNLYGSLNSVLSRSKPDSRVDYTISEDVSQTNSLARVSKLLAILDGAIFVKIALMAVNEREEEKPIYRNVENRVPEGDAAQPNDQTVSGAISCFVGLGCPLAPGQVLEALDVAVVAKKQIAKMSSGFYKLARLPRGRNSNGMISVLNRRQFWYLISNQYQGLVQHKVRHCLEQHIGKKYTYFAAATIHWMGVNKFLLKYTYTRMLTTSGVYTNAVGEILYNAPVVSEMVRIHNAIAGANDSFASIEVAQLLNLIAAVKDRKESARLKQIVEDINIWKSGCITYMGIAKWLLMDAVIFPTLRC